MAARLSSARMMVYNAAKAFDEGKDVAEISTLAAMSKVLATEAAHFACDEAVQIWGSMGYIKPSKVERLFRDKIGSASCRERVCQYVYISVFAGSLKKNKN